MPEPNGYCLKGPDGELLGHTFDTDRDECWTKSFDYLYENHRWMAAYWHQWEESIEAAKRKGYVMVPVLFTEMPG